MFFPLFDLHSQHFGSKTIVVFANISENATYGQYSFSLDVKCCEIDSIQIFFCMSFKLDNKSSETYKNNKVLFLLKN